ncbi:carboxymuconolactone decarboxylase family protein [Amycolatopsis anabasis]|uniref:carboxymuconolactone decarboxylase family protein n=1 Tax=Amycolatopsis anabasis TaxID=1840409 RepID=UPI00131AA9A6|nr:carboxymuconolactone decarboxylase family protein [Amycolatopsis anabasis]
METRETRLVPLPPEQWDAALREHLEQAERNTRLQEVQNAKHLPTVVINLIRTLAHHPRLTEALAPLLALLNSGELPYRDRELVILRTAVRNRSSYEWSHHYALAQLAGLTEQEVLDAGRETEAGERSSEDKVLLRAVDELHDRSVLTDSTWRELEQRYDERQLLELLCLVGTYRMIATVLNTCRVPLDEWQTERPFPDEEA